MTKDDLHVVYHVAAMGNWQDVVDEQIGVLCRAGLTSVLVTHVGGGLAWLERRFREAGIDAVVRKHEDCTDHYETLAMLLVEELVRESDKPVLYFHTKGVSNPSDHRKPIWRRLMQAWVVERWRQNLELLRDHDAVGVDWLHCDHPHFVGNFWMATAAYLRRQEPFATFHTNMRMNRFSCEFWIGWGNPKVHSHVCSGKMWWDLINQHGSDRPPETFVDSKTFLGTVAFCRPEMLDDCLDNLHPLPADVEQVVVDAHYPLNDAGAIQAVAERWGCRCVDAGRDRGHAANVNLILEAVGARRGDVLIGCDPDDRPQPGWCDAVKKVLTEHRWIGVCAVAFPLIHAQQAEDGRYREEAHSGHRVWLSPSNEMYRCCGFQLGFVIDTGGFRQPFAYYGGIETELLEQRLTAGLHLAYLPDFTCDWRPCKAQHDPEYVDWKRDHLAGFAGSFGEWLAKKELQPA